jgi:deoxycytidylate deaminase
VIPQRSYDIEDFLIEEVRYYRWLSCAAKLAHKSTYKKYKMAAVCVKGGRVVGVGFNKDKNGVIKNRNYLLKGHHAELDLILSMPKDVLKGSTIYVAGITRGGSLCWSSKPCSACQATLRSYGIKAAIYHDQRGRAYEWRTK